MAHGEDWLSALLGGVEGGFAGWSSNKKREAEEERQRKIEARQADEDAYRDEQRQFQREDREQRSRDRLRGDTESMLADIGRGGRLTPEQVEGARGVGLGHRVEDDVDFNHSIFAGAGPIPMMVPERVSEVAPTAEQRMADLAKEEERARLARMRGAIQDPVERQLFDASPAAYKPSRSAVMAPEARAAEARTAEDAAIAAKTREGFATLPIKMREAEERARIQAKYRPPAQPRDERIVQIMGPNGTPIYVRESDAVGKPAAQAARSVTGAERQALAYYNRAKEAVDTLTTPGKKGGRSLEERIAAAPIGKQMQLQHAPNIFQSSEQQAYRQAQRAFTEARLRKESGAAIPTAEYENDAKTYFAQPGDDAATIAQKRRARATVLQGMKFGAGKAYQEFYGDEAPPAGDVVVPDPRGGTQADPLGIR